jgi:hypothetical protein
MLPYIFLFLAGMLNGVMDVLSYSYNDSLFFNNKWFNPKFCNPSISWLNKYIDRDSSKGEKPFMWLLDGFTDLWHILKLLHNVLIAAAVVFSVSGLITDVTIVWKFISYWAIYEVGFELSWDGLKIKPMQ